MSDLVVKENIKKDRILALDILKAICVFIIFVYHFYMDIDYSHGMFGLSGLKDIIIRPNMHLALIACALFMMASGATLKLNYDGNIINFYKKRLLRILVPFYIAYFIAFCFKCINLTSRHIFDASIPFSNIIYTIFGMDEYFAAGGVSTFTLGVGEWFLGCIMICYLVFPIIHYLDKYSSFVFFLIFTAYYVYINAIYSSFDLIMPAHFCFICQVYHFYLGVYLMDTDFIDSINIFMIIIMAVVVIFSYRSLTEYDMLTNYKTSLVVPSIFLIFLKLEKVFNKIKNTKFIAGLTASLSFEFFLIHHVVIYQSDYMLRFMKLDLNMTICLFVFQFIFTIFMAIVIKTLTNMIYGFFLFIKSVIIDLIHKWQKNINEQKINAEVVR